MPIGIRKPINHMNKRLRKYLLTVDEEMSTSEDKQEYQKLIKTLSFEKQYL